MTATAKDDYDAILYRAMLIRKRTGTFSTIASLFG
jgi:hypothetical protein